MMIICEFVTSMCSGGAENFVRQLSLCARKSGHEITVLLLCRLKSTPYEKNAIHELEEAGIRVISLNLCQEHFHSFHLLWNALLFFSKNQFDVVHSHGAREDILTVLCRFLLFKHYRCISTLHRSKLIRTGLEAKIRFFLHRHFLISVFCGREAYITNRSWLPKSIYISNGVPINPASSEKKAIPPDLANLMSTHPVLVSVGRLEEPKCQIKQVEAMEKVVSSFPQCKLFICGKGSFMEVLQNAIMKKHLENNVFLVGERSDVSAILDNADFFISSSIYEGLPIAVLEALSHFKPALLSPIPAHKELEERIQGCLCAKDESSEALADLVINSIRNRFGSTISPDTYISEMSDFSIETCWNKYFDMYRY